MSLILQNKWITILLLSFVIGACGVKARPIAPTVAPAISNGVPNYYKKNEVEQVKNKYNPEIEEIPANESNNDKE